MLCLNENTIEDCTSGAFFNGNVQIFDINFDNLECDKLAFEIRAVVLIPS